MYWVFVCSIWDTVHWPGIEPWSPALAAQSLSHWASKEVPISHSWFHPFSSTLLCTPLPHPPNVPPIAVPCQYLFRQEEKGQQRTRWLDDITNSMDMSLNKLWRDSEGQRSLVCCSPWGHKESGKAERLNNNNSPLHPVLPSKNTSDSLSDNFSSGWKIHLVS